MSSLGILKSGIAKLQFYGSLLLKNCIFHGGKIAGRFIFPFFLIKNSKEYINSPSYFPEHERKGKLQIAMEQLIYIFKTGEINKNYFIFGFDRKFKNDFSNYVPWFTFVHYRNKLNQQKAIPVYDPYNYLCLLRDKFIFEAYCSRLGINTPENYGIIKQGELFLLTDKKFTSLENILNVELDAFCKKNVPYGQGICSNIMKLQISKGEIIINNKPVDFEEFKHIMGNDFWIIQKRIKNQAKEFAGFHPDSINTLRIITVKNGKSIEVIGALFRMGVNRNYIDNNASGGIIVGVNPEGGTLKKWGFFKPGYGTKSDRHPDSHIKFEGYKLPHWNVILNYAKRAHTLFYGFHSVGWDIAVTNDGILIIEGNDNWETALLQLYDGARNEFKEYFK